MEIKKDETNSDTTLLLEKDSFLFEPRCLKNIYHHHIGSKRYLPKLSEPYYASVVVTGKHSGAKYYGKCTKYVSYDNDSVIIICAIEFSVIDMTFIIALEKSKFWDNKLISIFNVLTCTRYAITLPENQNIQEPNDKLKLLSEPSEDMIKLLNEEYICDCMELISKYMALFIRADIDDDDKTFASSNEYQNLKFMIKTDDNEKADIDDDKVTFISDNYQNLIIIENNQTNDNEKEEQN